MKIGAQLLNHLTDWSHTRPVIEAIDAGHWSSLWTSDHFFPPIPGAGLEDRQSLDGWAIINAAAAITTNVRMGVLVTGNIYRNPGHLAKTAGTIDDISGGRLELGIGTGWYEREAVAYGWDFPKTKKELCDRMDEALEVISALFALDYGESASYQGTYYSLDEAYFSPKSPQSPRMPIMIGGNGEKRTLRSVAKYADICNLNFNMPGGVDEYKRLEGVLHRHCEDVGRDPAEIKMTMHIPAGVTDDVAAAEKARLGRPWTLYGSGEYIVDELGKYADAGCEEVLIGSVPTELEAWGRLNDEVVKHFPR